MTDFKKRYKIYINYARENAVYIYIYNSLLSYHNIRELGVMSSGVYQSISKSPLLIVMISVFLNYTKYTIS